MRRKPPWGVTFMTNKDLALEVKRVSKNSEADNDNDMLRFTLQYSQHYVMLEYLLHVLEPSTSCALAWV